MSALYIILVHFAVLLRLVQIIEWMDKSSIWYEVMEAKRLLYFINNLEILSFFRKNTHMSTLNEVGVPWWKDTTRLSQRLVTRICAKIALVNNDNKELNHLLVKQTKNVRNYRCNANLWENDAEKESKNDNELQKTSSVWDASPTLHRMFSPRIIEQSQKSQIKESFQTLATLTTSNEWNCWRNGSLNDRKRIYSSFRIKLREVQ